MGGFSLTPAEVPNRKRGGGHSVYEEIISQFEQADIESVKIDGTDIKPATLAMGLRKVVEERSLPFAVTQRKDEVFIYRIEQDAQADSPEVYPTPDDAF